jgi:hypothetical protein
MLYCTKKIVIGVSIGSKTWDDRSIGILIGMVGVILITIKQK